jgi:hypothetical protein
MDKDQGGQFNALFSSQFAVVLSVELVAKGILAGLKEGNVRSVSESLRKVEKLEVAPMSLNMFDFRNEAHSSFWDHSAFVRTYVMYLDQSLELMFFNRKTFFTISVAIANGGSGGGGGRFDGGRDNFRSLLPSSSRPYKNDYSGGKSSGYGNKKVRFGSPGDGSGGNGLGDIILFISQSVVASFLADTDCGVRRVECLSFARCLSGPSNGNKTGTHMNSIWIGLKNKLMGVLKFVMGLT